MKKTFILLFFASILSGCQYFHDVDYGDFRVNESRGIETGIINSLTTAYERIVLVGCEDVKKELEQCQQSKIVTTPEDKVIEDNVVIDEPVIEDPVVVGDKNEGTKENPFIDKRARHVTRASSDGGTSVGQCQGDEKFLRCYAGTTTIPYHKTKQEGSEGYTWWNMSVIAKSDTATCIDKKGRYYQWDLPIKGVRKFKCK